MAIISASYKTDIPAFYGNWLLQRLDAGWVPVTNPWNRRRSEISLRPADVDGFVFWTRNAAPFGDGLKRIAEAWPLVIQYTIIGYPRAIDRSVIESAQAIENVRALAGQFGRRAVVWRYDPIVMTSLTNVAWHISNFSGLAQQLAGLCDEVTVSFVQSYKKTQRNLAAAADRHKFEWFEPSSVERADLLGDLADIATQAGMQLTLCTQPDNLIERVQPARCIDPHRLFAGNLPKSFAQSRNRPGCLCAQAVDIGAYDTCPHGRSYCYAVGSPAAAKQNFAAHLASTPDLVVR